MKKIICILLTLSLIMGSVFCITTSAEEEETVAGESYDGCPFILVRGMLFDGLIVDVNTDHESKAFKGVDAKSVIKVVFSAIGKGIAKWDISAFTSEVCNYLNDIMGEMACGSDGMSKDPSVGVHDYPHSLDNYPELQTGTEDEGGILRTACDKFGAENVYYYNYDWRLDPLTHADKIAELVDTALRETGKDKVNIACASMGGIMTESYIYKYGSDKINRVLFLSSTFCGTYVTSDLLRGNIVIDTDLLYAYAKQMLGSNKALSILMDVLYRTGIMKAVVNLATDKLLPAMKDQVFDEFVRGTFGTMPSLWSLVQPENMDECVNYMFRGCENEYSAIIELTKKYVKMANEREAFLKQASTDGMQVCVVAGYNRICIPVYPGAKTHGDSILESPLMLGGAVMAPYGEALPDNYVAKNPAKVSPDRVMDLSDCLFPDSTWAVKGSNHVACRYKSGYSDFVFSLLDGEEQPTVTSNPKYPQFLLSSDAQTIEPLTK